VARPVARDVEVHRRCLKARACVCGPVCATLGFRRRVVVVSYLKSTLVVVGVRSSGASGCPRRGSPSSMSQGARVCVVLSVPRSGSVAELR